MKFPEDFKFGTSTSAYQIETSFEHDWKGVTSLDGHIFDQTTAHEKRWEEDVNLIATLAPQYRMSLMWSRLQRAPFADFDADAKQHYHQVLDRLRTKNVEIMMVLHHFTNPVWFSQLGGWEKKENSAMWLDFVKKLVEEFGDYISSWNTFNEPNVYACFGWIVGKFPPFKNNIILAAKVVKNMGLAHNEAYQIIKQKYPHHPVGISHNAAVFSAENVWGIIPAKLSDMWFMEFVPSHFEKVDFFGMSYYARINHDPLPVTMITTPEKLKSSGKDHDDMWEYYPEGLRENVLRYWKKYQKPIIITENGICTKDDEKREKAIYDYLSIIHQLISEGIPIQGYYYWSTWDNFEWALGPTYQFGLCSCHWETKERNIKPSGHLYSKIAHSKEMLAFTSQE